MTTVLNEQKSHKNVISPSPSDWIMLNANVVVTGEISGVMKDGRFFTDSRVISSQSIDLLTYGQTESHIHKVDGDSDMSNEINEFLKIPQVERIFFYSKQGRDYCCVVLSEDVDDISYQLAVAKYNIQDHNEDFDPEILYMHHDSFDRALVPEDAIEHIRG